MATNYANLPVGSVVGGQAEVGVAVSAAGSTSPRHLVSPLRLVDGPNGSKVFATVEQDSMDEVVQSVRLLLQTERGERYRDAPDYGVDELMDGSPVNTAAAAEAVQTFEPRAVATFTPGPLGADGAQSVRVDIALVQGVADATPSVDFPTDPGV